MDGGGVVNVNPAAENNAAVKVQKIFRSHRARRQLADSSVTHGLWWQALEYAELNKSTTSFFQNKPEPAVSKWTRVVSNASKVGQGLSGHDRSLLMAFWQWIEAIDPRHRYGKNLDPYYKEWCNSQTTQPFFYWLDIGDGKDLDLKGCPRSKLNKQCVKYLSPLEREQYEYVIQEGKIIHKQSGELLGADRIEEEILIYVMSSDKRLYVGQKIKGQFQHSSFLSGGAIIAAGTLAVKNGVLMRISPLSGHYRPKDENVAVFLDFLRENGADLDKIELNMDPAAERVRLEGQISQQVQMHQDSFNAETQKMVDNFGSGVLQFDMTANDIEKTALHVNPRD